MVACLGKDADNTSTPKYNEKTVALVLNTLIEVYESELSRIRTIEQKASVLLSASGILTGLASRGLLDASSTRPWMIGPAIAVVSCLAAGVINCLKVMTTAEYKRPDTKHLCKGEVLVLDPANCGGSLMATWHESVVSIEERAEEKICHYKRAHKLLTIGFVIALSIIAILLVELLN